jgi:hypothetical protein
MRSYFTGVAFKKMLIIGTGFNRQIGVDATPENRAILRMVSCLAASV